MLLPILAGVLSGLSRTRIAGIAGIVAAVGVTSTPRPILSQQLTPADSRVRVLVVLADSLPVQGVGAVIQHTGGAHPTAAIVMTPTSATARQLSAAVLTTLVYYASLNGASPAAGLIPVRMREGPAEWAAGPQRRAEMIVRRLRKEPTRYVPGFGFVRSRPVTLRRDAFVGKLTPARRQLPAP